MSRLKIGDRVEYTKNWPVKKGTKGTVKGFSESYLDGVRAMVLFDGCNTISFIRELSLVKLDETIVIFHRGNEVIALDKSTGERASAKCNPKDEFDFKVGAELAFNRLMGKPDEVKDDEIKVGDVVKVTDCGCTYSTMANWFRASGECELEKHFVHGKPTREGKGYMVRAIHPHEWAKTSHWYGDVYAIQDPDTTQVFLISKRGIEKVM